MPFHLCNHKSFTLALILTLGLIGPAIAEIHKKCSDCHVAEKPTETTAQLILSEDKLCLKCHENRGGMGQHAVGIATETNEVGGLPLYNGKIDCITCHDSHSKKKGLLRYNSDRLCLACHDQ